MTIPNLHDPELLERLRLFLGEEHSKNVAFIGGSLVEGFGNARSDIDVISVGDDEPTVTSFPNSQIIGNEHVIDVSSFEGTRVDSEIVSRRSVEKIISSVKDGIRNPGSITTTETTLLKNIYVGIPLFRVDEALEWRASLDWASWRSTLLRWCNLAYRGASEDAQGAIEAGNWWVAYYSSLYALDASIDALLISKGSMSMSGKWRMAYLSKFGLDETAREYWELFALKGGSPADAIMIAKKRLIKAQRWTSEVLSSAGQPA